MNQLRITTTEPTSMFGLMFNKNETLIQPNNIGEVIQAETKGSNMYIHGEAERLAGFDIPVIIDGHIGQLDLPINEQDILLILPEGEYKCKAEYYDGIGASDCYLITLFEEESINES